MAGKMTQERVLIIGGGNGALAFAAYLGRSGGPVGLWEFPEFRAGLSAIKENGRLDASGLLTGESQVTVHEDLAGALNEATLIFAVVPALAHGRLAAEIAPFLREDALLLLNPGRTFGALEVARTLRNQGIENPVAEAQTLLFACRRKGLRGVHISGIKKTLLIGVFPAKETATVMTRIKNFLPQAEPAPDVRYTSLSNIGAVFHPSTILLNLGLVEGEGAYEFYSQAMTPSLVRFLEKIDSERLAVARAAGAKGILDARSWLAQAYGLKLGALRDMLLANQAYRGITGPKELKVRYVNEDVPTGLVPLESLGVACGLTVPAISAMIDLAGLLLGEDFRATGRNLKKLGLAEIPASQYEAFFRQGRI